MELLAGAATLLFTTLLTIAGVGAAFILIPVFVGMGIDVHTAMATALLLNSIAMVFASYRFIKNKLIMWRVALPILVVATALSPLGAWVSQGLNRTVLLWLFVGFLVFAAVMMLVYRAKEREVERSKWQQISFGVGVGAFAGFIGGLLGVGGGNIIVPVLVWLGYNPKKASATTSFIIIFSSFSGFLGHATVGVISWQLLGLTGAAAAIGALLGSWLMRDKLNRNQVKVLIGVVLLGIAGKMVHDLVSKETAEAPPPPLRDGAGRRRFPRLLARIRTSHARSTPIAGSRLRTKSSATAACGTPSDSNNTAMTRLARSLPTMHGTSPGSEPGWPSASNTVGSFGSSASSVRA